MLIDLHFAFSPLLLHIIIDDKKSVAENHEEFLSDSEEEENSEEECSDDNDDDAAGNEDNDAESSDSELDWSGRPGGRCDMCNRCSENIGPRRGFNYQDSYCGGCVG